MKFIFMVGPNPNLPTMQPSVTHFIFIDKGLLFTRYLSLKGRNKINTFMTSKKPFLVFLITDNG